MSTVCQVCAGTDIEYDQARGDAVCTNCGSVLEDNIIVSEVTFAESTGGGSSVIGQFVSSDHSKSHVSGGGFHHGMGRDSREITLQNAKRRITDLGQRLRLNQHCIDTAFNFFKMALQMNLTRGRRSNIIDTACLYLVCRSEGTPHLLLDFSDVLQINVYALGRAFLKLSNALHINPPAIDPCLYIHRFAHKLELGDKTHEVSMTALRLVARMKRDWIHHGRRPSGLCGAALLVASRLHNFSRSVREVAKVVKLSGGTIRKRLGDFKDTPSSRLTIDEFLKVDLEQEHDPPSYIEAKKKAKAAVEGKPHPLNNSLKDPSADLSDDSRDDELAIGEEGEEGHGDEEEEEGEGGFSGIKMQSVKDIIAKARFAESYLRGGTGAELGENLDELAVMVSEQDSKEIEDCEDAPPTEDDKLADLDEKELDEMILSQDEVEIKSKLWFAENGDFLKEQELRRQRIAQEKAEKDKLRKKPIKPRKTKASQQGLASNAGEAIERMLVEKRISTKINYDVLKDLADGFGAGASEVANLTSSPSTFKPDDSSTEGMERTGGLLPPITRTPVARGRLPSLSARKRTFSSLEATQSIGQEPKFPRLQTHGSKDLSSTNSSSLDRAHSSADTDDFLTPVIDSRLEQLTTAASGDSVGNDSDNVVVEESGPVQYNEEEEGLDDEGMEELAYEDDPLLHSDYEDEGDYYDD